MTNRLARHRRLQSLTHHALELRIIEAFFLECVLRVLSFHRIGKVPELRVGLVHLVEYALRAACLELLYQSEYALRSRCWLIVKQWIRHLDHPTNPSRSSFKSEISERISSTSFCKLSGTGCVGSCCTAGASTGRSVKSNVLKVAKPESSVDFK